MPQAGFEPTISAGERPQTYALEHAVTGTGFKLNMDTNFCLQVAVKLQDTPLELNAPCTWSGV